MNSILQELIDVCNETNSINLIGEKQNGNSRL